MRPSPSTPASVIEHARAWHRRPSPSTPASVIEHARARHQNVRPPNVQANPLPDHGSSSGPSINMISVYVPAREPYLENKVPWAYGGDASSLEHQFSVMGVTRFSRVYENPEAMNKGKAPAAVVGTLLEGTPFPPKKVTKEEAEAFVKIIKASEYKVVEQMAKSPAHISLLALLLSSEPYREALLRVLTAAQVPKETAPDMIEETVSSIFSNTISFSDDELPSEGCSRALHIVCKCNNYIIGRVMIDNGFALNVCLVTTLKQMNVDLNRIHLSKTAVRAFDGSRREVNGEIDLLIDIGPCLFSVTFQVLDIPNAFSLLLGRPWIHSAGAVPSSLHQRLKFIVEENLITVKGEEDYAIYKETAVPYISIGDDENLHFHSFKIISGISCPIEVEDYKNKRGLGFRPSCHEIVEARRGNHLHHLVAHYGRINKGILVLPLSHFFPGPPHIVRDTLDRPSLDSNNAPDAPPTVYTVTEETPSGVHIRLAQENEELENWTSVPRYSIVIADV
ncbi:hypothetical protein CRG98_044237 [Punica granatum]|uniref:Uncharacterized protein n=1 Tax=Punica granatum TaxID=22663 RepID=A0A2I0HV16_PUNGR|nr:hypothetical protein CRG98_044237 [Punica granatum]